MHRLIQERTKNMEEKKLSKIQSCFSPIFRALNERARCCYYYTPNSLFLITGPLLF